MKKKPRKKLLNRKSKQLKIKILVKPTIFYSANKNQIFLKLNLKH